MDFPEHVKCIRSPRGEQKLTLCGRFINFEFVLLDIGHAYMLGDQASLQACPACVDEAIRGLQKSRFSDDVG